MGLLLGACGCKSRKRGAPGRQPGSKAPVSQPGRLRPAQAGSEKSVSPETIRRLCADFQSDNVEALLDAREALVKIGGPAVPGLVEVLKANDPRVRVFARDALVEIGAPAVPGLMAVMKADDSFVRWLAIMGLGQIGPDASPAVGALVELLSGDNGLTSLSAGQALAKIGPAAVPKLLEAITQPQKRAVGYATRALGEIGPPAIHALVEVVSDRQRDPEVRRRVIRALGSIGPAARVALPTLLRIQAEQKPEFTRAVENALAQIEPTEKRISALITSLTGDDRSARANAASVLAVIGLPAKKAVSPTVRVVSRMLQEPIDHPRSSTTIDMLATFFGKVGPEATEAVPILTKLLKHKDFFLRVSAAQALGHIGPGARRAIPSLAETAKSDRNEHARRFAAEALAKIRQAPASPP